MSRMENLDTEIEKQQAMTRAQVSAEGGMTDDDLYMVGGKLAAMFCIGFAFLVPSLLLWRVVF
jgi:hypothetical protein